MPEWAQRVVMMDIFRVDGFLKALSKDEIYKVPALISGTLFIYYVSRYVGINNVLLIILFELIWVLVWLRLRAHLPSNKKNKIGIVVSCVAENEKQKIRVRSDLIGRMQRLFEEHGIDHLFHIIILSNYHSSKINKMIADYVSEYRECLRRGMAQNLIEQKWFVRRWKKMDERIKAHLYIYGNIIERQSGSNAYILEFKAQVKHRPVTIGTSRSLANEMRAVLFREIKFKESYELEGFEVTADLMAMASIYIVGLAAYISGDPYTALKLHKTIKDGRLKGTQRILPRLDRYLSYELYFISLDSWKKGNKTIDKILYYLEQSIQMYSKNYDSLIMLSILAFKEKKDPIKSMRYIVRAERCCNGDYTWLYNRAFLYIYLGKYEKGVKDYSRIAGLKYPDEEKIVDQCIEFNKELIKNEPQKIQSFFILGFLEHKKKKHLPAAQLYFESFIEKAESKEEYVFLLVRAKSYLGEIKKQQSIP